MEENLFACRIRNQRTFCLWNPESLALESRKYSSRNRINHSSLPPGIQNPESKTLCRLHEVNKGRFVGSKVLHQQSLNSL